MAYVIVNGTSGSNFMAFQGLMGFYNETLVNPYTGYTVTVTGNKNINNGIYDGMGGTDTLSMTSNGDILALVDSAGTIMIKNIEVINAGADGDVVNLAHNSLTYGNVTIRGADGDDVLWSNVGNDLMQAGLGNDIMDGAAGNDQMYGGGGDDYMSGGLGTDSLFGGAGDDMFAYNADSVWSGGHTLASLGSNAYFAHLVSLDGKNQSYDTFHGDTDEILNAAIPGGNDTLILTSGSDVLVNGDTISPIGNILPPRIDGVENILAGDGDDVVDLSALPYINVTIDGGTGADMLASSNGNDTLIGGTGDDLLSGGTGDDTYVYNLGDGSDTIYETSGADSIKFGAGISFSDLTLAKMGDDLQVTIAGNTLTIIGHYAADLSGRVETLVFDDNSTYDLGSYGLNVDPTAVDDVFSGNEDEEITGNVLANDSDDNNDTLSVTPGTFVTSAGGSVVLNADGSFTYQGAVNFHGTDGFSYTVNDGMGGTATANVVLNVASVNDTPVAIDDVFAGNEDEAITGSLLGNDSDIDGGTLSAVAETSTTANGGTATINTDGTFSYQGAANFYGADSFDYTLNDGQGGTDIGTVSLDVASVNDAPVAVDDTFSGNEDEAITGSLLGNDSDIDGGTLSAVAETITTANGGTVTINTDGTFSYQGAANFYGTDSFDYTLNDGQGGTDIGTVSLDVASVNDAPVAMDDTFSGNEDEEITGNVLSNDSDIDGGTLTVTPQTITTANGGQLILNANGTFSYLGATNFHGTDSFSYTITDGQGGTAMANATLHVASINDAPVALDDSFNLFRNGNVTGNVLTDGVDSDVDGGTLTVTPQTITTAQGGSVALNADGSFTYTPAEDFFGEDSFDYTLLDGQGGTDTATVTLVVELDPAYSIIGTPASDVLSGTEGNDEIFGLGCPDILFGENGNDEIYGGAGNDIIYGDDGILSGVVMDKAFSDTVVFPTLKEGTNITNLKPPGTPSLGVANNNLSVDFDATATITFRKGYAGYDNSFGSFGIAADGTIVSADMLWANVKNAGINTAHQIDIPVGANGGEFGFFVIGNGNVTNNGYAGLNVTGNGNLSFMYNYGKSDQRAAKVTDLGSKISLVYNDGVTTKVLQGSTFFTTDRGDAGLLNRDGKVHVVSGLMDNNNINLDMVAADLAAKPQSFTKNGFVVSAVGGVLIADGNKFGVKSADSVKRVSGDEAVHVAVSSGAEKVTFGLSFITGGNTAVDFKIYMNGSTTPIVYEHVVTGPIVNGLYDIALYASQFGPGVITGIEISSRANSSYGTEAFYINTLSADIPGGIDTGALRIGFEDLHGTGDADYEDVLFDLNINPVNLGDIEGGNDILDGGAGNDTLYGEGGDDIIIMGLGADTAYGGKGADVFAITLVDGQVDRIVDFDCDQGDTLNVTDVLEGYDPLTDHIWNFVRFYVSNGVDYELQIRADGQYGSEWVTAAVVIGDGDGNLDNLLNLRDSALIATESALA